MTVQPKPTTSMVTVDYYLDILRILADELGPTRDREDDLEGYLDNVSLWFYDVLGKGEDE